MRRSAQVPAPPGAGRRCGVSLPTFVARPLIAGIFVAGGLQALRRGDAETEAAGDLVEPNVTQATGLNSKELVKVNGAAQVVAGVFLALGILPRPAATVLAVSLVPTTLAGHRFWEADGDEKPGQMIHFLKNVSMLGGLILAATDTGGRPSLPWRARRAVARASDSAGDAIGKLQH